jgi:hypothetical protein
MGKIKCINCYYSVNIEGEKHYKFLPGKECYCNYFDEKNIFRFAGEYPRTCPKFRPNFVGLIKKYGGK